MHARSIFEEFAAKSATHDVVKLLLYEFVAVLLDHFFLALTNSTFATKTDIERLFVARMFC